MRRLPRLLRSKARRSLYQAQLELEAAEAELMLYETKLKAAVGAAVVAVTDCDIAQEEVERCKFSISRLKELVGSVGEHPTHVSLGAEGENIYDLPPQRVLVVLERYESTVRDDTESFEGRVNSMVCFWPGFSSVHPC